MESDLEDMLETLLIAQVLTLAKLIKAEKAAGGMTSTSDYTPEAAKLIAKNRLRILALLQENP